MTDQAVELIAVTPCGPIYQTNLFWDCECPDYYIHPRGEDYCSLCDSEREDQPDSIVSEVLEQLDLSPAVRERLRAEGADRRTHSWGDNPMVQPARDRVATAFLQIGSYNDKTRGPVLEGDADLYLDEKGQVWARTPWVATDLPSITT
jgi:hypothetical protein